MPRLFARRVLEGVRAADVAGLDGQFDKQAAIDEARWVLDHLAWPDGRPITPAEKSEAQDTLRADRIARTRR